MNWTLIVVAVILLAGIIVGAFKGLIKMAYSLLVMVIITVVTSFCAPKLASYLKANTTWDDALEKKTESFLEDKGILKDNEEIEIADLPIPSSITKKIEKSANDYKGAAIEKYNSFVVETTSSVIFSAIVYACVFILLLALTSIIGMMLDVISKLPVLKQLNKFAGAAIGLCLSLIVVWTLAIIVMVFNNFNFATYINKDIDSNPILKFLYDKNLIMYFVTKFLA